MLKQTNWQQNFFVNFAPSNVKDSSIVISLFLIMYPGEALEDEPAKIVKIWHIKLIIYIITVIFIFVLCMVILLLFFL